MVNGSNNIEKENNQKETIPDWIYLIVSKALTIFSLGKLSFLESLFNTIVMPILETGGVEKDSLETVLEFLKNPILTHDELLQKIESINFKQDEQLNKLGKVGRVSLMLTQSLIKTALFTVYPGIGLTIGKLNTALSEMKQKIEELQNRTDVSVASLKPSAAKPLVAVAKPLVAVAAKPLTTKKLHGGISHQNKTKIKQRINKSIKQFHKTNNLRTLKREIQRIKLRITRHSF